MGENPCSGLFLKGKTFTIPLGENKREKRETTMSRLSKKKPCPLALRGKQKIGLNTHWSSRRGNRKRVKRGMEAKTNSTL